MRPDGIYFDHSAPRGPGSANAYVLFDAGVPAASYLEQINAHIRDQGNHGHGDDLQVMEMPVQNAMLNLTVFLPAETSQAERDALQNNIKQFVRAAFRENTDYHPTLTYPQSRFSFSRLLKELHEEFPEIVSMRTPALDLQVGLWIPRLQTLKREHRQCIRSIFPSGCRAPSYPSSKPPHSPGGLALRAGCNGRFCNSTPRPAT